MGTTSTTNRAWNTARVCLGQSCESFSQKVTADQYPWLASSTSLDAAVVPRWAIDGGYPALIKRFDDPAAMAKIRDEMIENIRRRGP